jgi:hypothetical protein
MYPNLPQFRPSIRKSRIMPGESGSILWFQWLDLSDLDLTSRESVSGTLWQRWGNQNQQRILRLNRLQGLFQCQYTWKVRILRQQCSVYCVAGHGGGYHSTSARRQSPDRQFRSEFYNTESTPAAPSGRNQDLSFPLAALPDKRSSQEHQFVGLRQGSSSVMSGCTKIKRLSLIAYE